MNSQPLFECTVVGPTRVVSRHLRHLSATELGKHPTKEVSILHVSDTHNRFNELPIADILIHSGDFTNSGVKHGDEELDAFAQYLCALPHRVKIVVPGNHEKRCDRMSAEELQTRLRCTPDASNVFLLLEDRLEVEGITFFGSPFTNAGGAWHAETPEDLARHWERIPQDVDVLITHMPPHKIFDFAWNRDGSYSNWGCKALAERAAVVKPALHCFGHVHDETGTKMSSFGTCFSNAAMDLSRACNLFTFITAASAGGGGGGGGAGLGGVAKPAVARTGAAVSTARIAPATTAAVGCLELVASPSETQADGESPLVLDLDAADATRRTVFLWPRRGGKNQQWILEELRGPIMTLPHDPHRIFAVRSLEDPSIALVSVDGKLAAAPCPASEVYERAARLFFHGGSADRSRCEIHSADSQYGLLQREKVHKGAMIAFRAPTDDADFCATFRFTPN